VPEYHTALVATDWLAAHLGDPGLRVVDARWRGDGSSRELYRAGHIPGAVHLDWQADLGYVRQGVRDLILPPERFAAVMGAAGIGDETLVVAYAETDYSGAARLWWALRYYGHERAVVLNGGFTKWRAEGRPLSTEIPLVSQARFTPHLQPNWIASAVEILVSLGDPAVPVSLIDTRPPEQYAGLAVWTPPGSLYLPPGQAWVDAGGRRLRGGHIPGAVSLPSSGNLDPADWTFLAPEALRERALQAGINPEDRIVLYCGVGISASLGLLALHLAGFRDLALYDASWEEWGHDPRLPIERD
jgi:thiosulfate/3-mercaptopyruvate sulfurtransferase